jgi:hypothetical protein
MMEQQFAKFLLDRIDEKVKGMSDSVGGEIRLHLKELRVVVDTALEGSKGRGKGGGTNA